MNVFMCFNQYYDILKQILVTFLNHFSELAPLTFLFTTYSSHTCFDPIPVDLVTPLSPPTLVLSPSPKSAYIPRKISVQSIVGDYFRTSDGDLEAEYWSIRLSFPYRI